jgi:hypothetical protein
MDPVRRYRLSMLVLGGCALVYGGLGFVRGDWGGTIPGLGQTLLVAGGAVTLVTFATGIDGTEAEPARRNAGIAAFGAAMAAIGTGIFLLGTVLGVF